MIHLEVTSVLLNKRVFVKPLENFTRTITHLVAELTFIDAAAEVRCRNATLFAEQGDQEPYS